MKIQRYTPTDEFKAAERYARQIPKMKRRNSAEAVLRLCEKLHTAIKAGSYYRGR